MSKNLPYTCPRCDYSAERKHDMYKHLYERKNPCANRNNLELSSDIKTIVLRDRKYYPEQNPNPVVQNNFITNLEVNEKLDPYLQYTGKVTTDINDYAEMMYLQTVERLDKDQFRAPHLIGGDKFLELVDDLVKTDPGIVTDMNVVYDSLLDRIRIYCDGEWESYFIESGIKRLITILRTNYLDRYECYLYKKIFQDPNLTGVQYNDVKLHLSDYYKFLATFGHLPFVHGEPISSVLERYTSDNPNELRDYGMKIYDSLKSSLNKTDVNADKRQILDIIKRNHRKNVQNLNSAILELINVDSEFKQMLLK